MSAVPFIPVALILGAGANVGSGVARAFAARGYKVAISSRTYRAEVHGNDYHHVPCDLSDPDAVAGVFEEVRKALGPPSVVVYNAATFTSAPKKDDPLSLPWTSLQQDLSTNTLSVLAAAHQATLLFDELPASASRTFIYTGNKLNTGPIPPMLSLGIGKSATAHMMQFAAQAYQGKGYKFYYADERKADGGPMYNGLDGDAHGKFYVELSEAESQGPWSATFVKGTGYVDFSKQS